MWVVPLTSSSGPALQPSVGINRPAYAFLRTIAYFNYRTGQAYQNAFFSSN